MGFMRMGVGMTMTVVVMVSCVDLGCFVRAAGMDSSRGKSVDYAREGNSNENAREEADIDHPIGLHAFLRGR